MARPRRNTDEREGIVDRILTFCPRLQAWSHSRLIRTCTCCQSYTVHCCACDMREWERIEALSLSSEQAEAVWEMAVENRVATNATCHHFR
jgi:hypothetical protein